MRLPDWLGFRGKTLWDWLQLLIVPAILIGVTFAWSATQTRSDNRREDRRIAADRTAAEEARQSATLRDYLGQMSGLMLDKKLLTSEASDPVRSVARTVTLTTLRRLNESRKAKSCASWAEAEPDLCEREQPRKGNPLVADLTGRRPRGRRPFGRRPQGRQLFGRRPQGRRPHGRRPQGRQLPVRQTDGR